MCIRDRGDTGHSEKSHLCGRDASAEDIYRNKVPICPQGKPVSYTHLDVYKRQSIYRLEKGCKPPEKTVDILRKFLQRRWMYG